jgi:hypothetical protein
LNAALVQQLVARTGGLGFLNELLRRRAMIFLKLPEPGRHALADEERGAWV